MRTKPYSKGVIGIPAYFVGRYRDFDQCLAYLQTPNGTAIEWQIGANIAHNLNKTVKYTLSEKYYEWLFILDDDTMFKPDILVKLLDRDVDIVVPLCLRRSLPFSPILHGLRDTDYAPCNFDSINGKSGLMRLTNNSVGNGGMLIKRKVLETMKEPIFEYGKTFPDQAGHDITFCEKAINEGFELYLDLDNTIGHIMHVAVWADKDENNNYKPAIRVLN